MKRLTGKTALITGGSSGIGLATARAFIEEGAKVAVTGRNLQALERARQVLGENALALATDVTDFPAMIEAYRETVGKWGKIDVLFANAGVAQFKPLSDIDEIFFDSIMDTNVKGLFFTIKNALPFLNDGASIILTGSSVSVKGRPGSSVYAATKAAVRSLARGFSADLIGRKIRVNVVSPGPVDTPIFEKMGKTADEHERTRDLFRKNVPLARLGEADEIARVVCFLASDDSSFVLGSEIFVDGGVSQL